MEKFRYTQRGMWKINSAEVELLETIKNASAEFQWKQDKKRLIYQKASPNAIEMLIQHIQEGHITSMAFRFNYEKCLWSRWVSPFKP